MKMTMSLGLPAALALACAAQPRPEAAPVAPRAGALSMASVESGQLSAAPSDGGAVSVFRGIPYAAPPMGALRWGAPEPAAAWSGVRAAAEFSRNCVQKVQRRLLPWTEEYMPQREMSEDCLALNVWTGAVSAAERRPVLVYVHGGAYTGGSGDVLVYDGAALAGRGVVVVTINYRLGVFGFFSHPALTEQSGHGASGNYGLLDQIAALGWVQRNIAAFGGDPQNVTVAGQSAGAGSVHLLTTSPLARGLFQRAIAQSGPWDPRQRLSQRDAAENRGLQLARGRSLADLRALGAEVLRDEAIASGAPFRPIVDGWVVPDQVTSVYERGQQIDVPLLTGVTADEESSQSWYGALDAKGFEELIRQRFPERTSEVLSRYTAAAPADMPERQKQFSREEALTKIYAWRQVRSRHGTAPDFAYYFERPIPWPEQPRYQAFHSAELPYVFDNLAKLQRPWQDVDRELAQRMASYWVNFMRQGDPNGDGLPAWPSDRERVLRLGAQVRAEVMPDAEVLRLMAGRFSAPEEATP